MLPFLFCLALGLPCMCILRLFETGFGDGSMAGLGLGRRV